VWWVELQARGDPSLVPGAVAEVLGVDDAPHAQLHDALVARVAGRDLLVVLDNCEHLIDACASLVHELLVRCPRLHILATSRQPLAVDGERLWRVPSLSVPSAAAALGARLESARRDSSGDRSDDYYRHWLAALEDVTCAKGLATPELLASLKQDWRAAYLNTPHGRPVSLPPQDG
jgi:hypothetical protein